MGNNRGNRKRWILFSTLSLAGGLILTTNSGNNVKADTVSNPTSDSETVAEQDSANKTATPTATPSQNESTQVSDQTTDNQVSYAINYVDSTSNETLQSSTGTADGGSTITIPSVAIPGYKQNASSQYQLAPVTTDADKNQSVSVPMAEAPDVTFSVRERESDDDMYNQHPAEDLKVNDSNYKNEVKTWLSTLQKGRKIDFDNSTYNDHTLSSLDYLNGMEDSTPSDIVLKILENEGSTDVLSESLSGQDLVFGFKYLPIDRDYKVQYVGVGGPKNGLVVYTDDGTEELSGKLPSTPMHRGIAPNTVPGYQSTYFDENDISFDEASGILTYKVAALPDAHITVNEYDKNKKLVKTVNWVLPANSTYPTQPISDNDPVLNDTVRERLSL